MVLAPLVRAVAHAASISVLGATVALAQHPPSAQAHAPSGDQATLLGTWAGSFVMEAKGGMELLVARDSAGAGWRVRMQLMVDHPFPPVDVRDFKVDGKTVTWLSDLMGTTCKAKAALDGNTMKGDMVCDARTLTFDLTKKA